MCLIVFSELEDLNRDSEYSFILLANRDEYYDRPTAPMGWWPDSFLAGKDLKAGGTWLGVSNDGRFAAVTNYKEDPKLNKDSRGDLVRNFLNKSILAKDYLPSLKLEDYSGFNLILIDQEGIHYSSNRSEDTIEISKEVNALGNRLLNSDTKKVREVRSSFKRLIQNKFSEDDLVGFMREKSGDLFNINREEFIDKEDQEFPYRFIKSDVYGTRCTTVFLIKKCGEIVVKEQVYLRGGEMGLIRSFTLNQTNPA